MNKSAFFAVTTVSLLALTVAGAGVNLSSRHSATPDDPALRLVLNVPAHRLYVFEHGEHTKTYKVSVGPPGHQTPAGSYKVSQAIWNPWWHPPASPWARGRKPESPGPSNPMGRAKLNFAPLLYIHGTQDRAALGDPASHGCVRMMNDDLIEFTRLVQSYTTPDVSEEVIARLVDNPTETRKFNFKSSVPFEVVYNVAAVQNGFLYFYPDIYSQVKPKEVVAQVKDVLADHGIAYSDVKGERLDELMDRGRKARVMISLDELRAISAAAAPSASAAADAQSSTGAPAGSR